MIGFLIRGRRPAEAPSSAWEPLLAASRRDEIPSDGAIRTSSDIERPPMRLERLNRTTLAYLAIRSSVVKRSYVGVLDMGMDRIRIGKKLSSCMDGSEPYAEIPLASRSVYLAAQADREGKGIDLHFYEKPGSDREATPFDRLDLRFLDAAIYKLLAPVTESLNPSSRGRRTSYMRSITAVKVVASRLEQAAKAHASHYQYALLLD